MADLQTIPQSAIRRRSGLRFTSHVIVDGAAISCVLSAMVAANVEWLFTGSGWLDTWIYFGFFRHYDVPSFLDNNKKIARLPWILLGYVVNKLLSPEVAAFVLHLSLFTLGASAFYWLALSRFGRSAAVISTLAYITWVPLHGSGGWDYHNTFTPVLYFSAYLSLMHAASTLQRPFLNFFKFGALFAITLHTDILVVLLVPGLALVIAHRTREWYVPGMKGFRPWLERASAGCPSCRIMRHVADCRYR